MRLPARPAQHIIEDQSFKILLNSLPDHWIVRDVTGKDYGIDCYIELVNNKNEVLGDLISIQLKGVEKIQWSKNDDKETYTFSGIKTSTVNYWMNLPVPTFLVVVDVNTEGCYFVSIESQVRKQYQKLQEQKTFSFNINKLMDLSKTAGLGAFLFLYFKEKGYSKFSFHLSELLINLKTYSEFLSCNINRDQFLEVDENVVFELAHIYKTIQLISSHLSIQWDVISFEDALELDQKKWGHSGGVFHESTITKIISEVIPVLIEIINKAIELVTIKQKHYWEEKNNLLLNYCNSEESQRTIKECIEELSWWFKKR